MLQFDDHSLTFSRILVGGQNGECDKPKVQVVKQFVPYPYFVPKPVYKYILRHHYVPVRQVVVKPVPVPYPVKSNYGGGDEYKKSTSGGYANGGGNGGYQNADSGYGSGYNNDDNSYSGSSIYGKYAPFDNSAKTSATGYTSSYKRQFNSYIPSTSSALTAATSAESVRASSLMPYASALSGTNLKASASENYFYDSHSKSPNFNNMYGGQMTGNYAATPNTGVHNRYAPAQLYAPIYQGPNGQLYSSGQVYPGDYLSKNANISLASAASSAMYSSVPMPMAMQTSTSASKKSQKKYKSEIERAKKMLTSFAKREDSMESSSSSSSSEEDSTEKVNQ